MGKGATSHTAASSVSSIAPPPHPPLWFKASRWFIFSCTVAVAIGMLALLDQQLTGIPWTYDGSVQQYLGRTIRIHYCMLSPSTDASLDPRCNFAFAVASVSLALSLIWSYVQVLRRNPFKHPSVKLADVVLTSTWALLWLVAAVLLCVWADAANKAGSFLEAARNARNGLCAMAWVEFLLVALLMCTAGLLFLPKCQALFDSWEQKSKEHKCQQEQQRLNKQRAQVQEQEAAAAAVAAASRQSKQAAATVVQQTPPQAAAAAGGGGALAGHVGVPVSTPASQGAAAEGSRPAGRAAGIAGGAQGDPAAASRVAGVVAVADENPFR